jgi:hypothetical protein
MQKPSELALIRTNVRLMRLDFEFTQGVEQRADVHAS